MKSLSVISKSLIILSIITNSTLTYADGDGGKIFKDWFQSKSPGVSAVKFQQYNEICGSCHFPYQPGLLPAVSWEKIMSNTDNHFGITLKLSAVESRTMTRYLLDNSAGHVNDEVSYNILRSLKFDPIVIQITKTPYFVNKHSQLDYKDNTKNIGQCDNCHQGAIQGRY
ncbi:MAG: diheme cytochrome c [Gammaproteobacteria bacterium]|nr:diheme cytochrome c [Gammaproteobacteria bacterium]